MTDTGWHVRARCSECGDVRLPLARFTVYRDHYSFDCPECGHHVIRNCSPYIRALLTPPAELLEHPHGAPALSADDLLDLIVGLRDPGFLSELAPRLTD